MGRSESGKDHLSLSSMNLYNQCPKKWKIRYIDHIREPPTVHAEVGSFVHLVLENLIDLVPHRRTLEETKTLATLLFEGDEATNTKGFRNDENFIQLGLDENGIKDFKKKVWLSILAYFRLEDPSKVDAYGNELEIAVDISGVPFYGKLDRLDRSPDGGIDIIDYKTGAAPLPWYRKKKFVQLQLYVAALCNYIRVVRPNNLKLIFMGGETPEIVSIKANQDEVREQAKEFRKTWDAIQESKEAHHWPPKTSPLCEWCPYVAECPEGTEQVLKRHRQRKVREAAPAVKLLGLEGPYKDEG